jgi:hypothetical protein
MEAPPPEVESAASPIIADEDDDELENILAGDALCEQILDEAFKP